MEGEFHSRKMTVNVFNHEQKCYRGFVVAMAQHSSCSTILFDSDFNVEYFNNRLGTFDGTDKRDTSTVYSMCSYLDKHYTNSTELYYAIMQCNMDWCDQELLCSKKTGEQVKIKLIPIVEDMQFCGLILLARVHGWVSR